MRNFPYRCPNPKCRAVLAMPESLRGRPAKCGKCSQEFVAPLLGPILSRGDGGPVRPLKKAG